MCKPPELIDQAKIDLDNARENLDLLLSNSFAGEDTDSQLGACGGGPNRPDPSLKNKVK